MFIMIVDNSNMISQQIQQNLKQIGMERAVIFPSSYEAYDYLAQAKKNKRNLPHIIFIHLETALSEYAEMCKKIKNELQLKGIPILVSTSNELISSFDQIMMAGADDFIQAPFQMNELIARIKQLLYLKKQIVKRKEAEGQLNTLMDSLKSDIDLAKQVQKSMLSRPFSNENISIDVRYIPSAELSGDLYQWKKISEHRYALMICDISGHGIPSALVSMSIFSLLDGLFTRVTEPVQVIQELNRHMYRLYMSQNPLSFVSYYFTAIYLILDLEKKEIEYINAGHPPGLLFHSNGEIELLETGCAPIGLLETLPTKKGIIQYEKEATLFLYSDGLTEIKQNQTVHDHYVLQTEINDHSLENERLLDKIIENRLQKGVTDDICLIRIRL